MASGQGKPIYFRPPADLRKLIEARAAEKGISLNEWLVRASTSGVSRGGTLKITTVVEAEF